MTDLTPPAEPARLKVKEAIRLLEHALGDRPFVLIYELAHRNTEVSHLRIHEPRAQPIYVTVGLLQAASLVIASEVRQKPPDGPTEP